MGSVGEDAQSRTMDRLRYAIAIAAERGLYDIIRCSLGESALPSQIAHSSDSKISLHQCIFIFFGKNTLMRLFEDADTERFHAVFVNSNCIMESSSYSRRECEQFVDKALSIMHTDSHTLQLAKNIARIQVWQGAL